MIASPNEIGSSTPSSETENTKLFVSKAAGRHPLELQLQPRTLCRYPKTDYSESEKFPPFLPMSQSDVEYIQHIHSQLAASQEAVLHAKAGMTTLAPSGRDAAEYLAECEEKVEFFRELLRPYAKTALADVDHVYLPRAIGLLSHWPLYDLLADWLKELVRCTMDLPGSLDYGSPLARAPVER
ncbi:hypothetical protein HK405_006161 [Cladochytrium tenue]|nr:hypothetical protein HK405_006161 [Cladochytrium tenue]